jgi:hypothetical protein
MKTDMFEVTRGAMNRYICINYCGVEDKCKVWPGFTLLFVVLTSFCYPSG